MMRISQSVEQKSEGRMYEWVESEHKRTFILSISKKVSASLIRMGAPGQWYARCS